MYNQGKSYDTIAAGFAKIRDSFNTEQKYIDSLIEYLPKKSHILDIGCLDIGCGSGFPIATYLIEKNFQVTGVDGSQELLNIAKAKCPKMRGLYGDIRTIVLNETFDAIIEWWCLFHVPTSYHRKMIERFYKWLKPGGVVEFTTGNTEYEHASSNMLNQELHFYSLAPSTYQHYLKEQGFEILLKESDQEDHLVWIAKKI